MADPYFDNVTLLLPMDGYAAASALLPDCSHYAQAVALFGDAALSTAQSKFGGKSLALGGAGYAGVTLAGITFGTADFTLRGWVYLTSYADYRTLYDSRADSHGTANGFAIGVDAAGRFYLYTDGDFRIRSGSVPLNQWVHIAFVRSSGVFTAYIDGIALAATYSASPNLSRTAALIGAAWPLDNKWVGYVDDFETTVGVARYTADFTPPGALEYEAWTLGGGTAGDLIRYSPYEDSAPSFNTACPALTVVGDTIYGGVGQIVGTVKQKSTPSNLPLIRKVRLHRQRDGVLIRETWSNSAGDYAFAQVEMGELYYAISFDHLGNYRGVIADSLLPSAM